ncbi:hypothetical protein OH491_13545 [Termitidicoccus mucosus]|uniref:Uncharacterized protein n=1 Tax=Termitidicoccus mucosus TaxID=1184151 RepID=A0A178IH80_9BACT|nr:hypothetical protein AW736_13900 [Opitutaceae bacterium TSB47]
MLTLAPMPLDAAVAQLESRTPVASALSSAQWAQMDLGLKERAFFMSRVESLRTVATAQQKIRDALSMADAGRMDRANFVSDMRRLLGAAPGDSGELTDITSNRRLSLVYEHNVADAREAAAWQTGQDPDLLDEYPAQELVRHEDREEPRDWASIWANAGGSFYGGRMIALKSDAIWEKISRFGKPWPPFDFGSGMGVEDIGRDEAEALGLIKPGERPRSIEADFNAKLEAAVPEATPALLDGFRDVFGDQVDVARDGRITWQGQRVLGLYEKALADPAVTWDISLGTASPQVAAQAAELAGAELRLSANELRHIQRRHIAAEADSANRPVNLIDLQLIPQVWRSPDQILPGTQPGTYEFRADYGGTLTTIVFDRTAAAGAGAGKRWGVKTTWVKTGGARP